MDHSGPAVWRACGASLVIACGALLAPDVAARDAGRQPAVASQPQAVDEAAVKAELRRRVEQRKRELRPEYERRSAWMAGQARTAGCARPPPSWGGATAPRSAPDTGCDPGWRERRSQLPRMLAISPEASSIM